MTPKEWHDATIGRQFDTDSYPRSNPYQCWDYFDVFCRQIGFDGSRYCGSTGYVGDLWMLRDADGYHYYTAFDYITDPSELTDGDWVFWEKHVAMYYRGYEVGQNQPDPYVTQKTMNWDGILGAMRYKNWDGAEIAYGASDVTINGHSYSLYRQSPNEKIAVLGAGLNEVAPFKDLTAELVYAKVGGANYFQMRTDVPGQPYGMTFGDVSAPLSGMYQEVSNQDSTLFYDLETGAFGDCTDVYVNPTHNVFSPALVYPNANGHFEYARMVGSGHKNTRSTYTFVMRLQDGYCLGIANQEMTPQEIAYDFPDCVNISFLDGGGSAQMGRWNGRVFEYIRDTGREIPSVVAIYREANIVDKPVFTPPIEDNKPVTPEDPVETPEDNPVEEPEEKPAEKPAEEEKPMNENDKWQDPETGKTIIDRIVALLAVKSIITLACLYTFVVLVLNDKVSPEQFMMVFSTVIAFYFGTTFQKGGKS